MTSFNLCFASNIATCQCASTILLGDKSCCQCADQQFWLGNNEDALHDRKQQCRTGIHWVGLYSLNIIYFTSWLFAPAIQGQFQHPHLQMISVFLPAPPPQKDTTLLANCILNTNIPHFSWYNTSSPTKIVDARYNPREKTQELETGYQSMLRSFKHIVVVQNSFSKAGSFHRGTQLITTTLTFGFLLNSDDMWLQSGPALNSKEESWLGLTGTIKSPLTQTSLLYSSPCLFSSSSLGNSLKLLHPAVS